jgi:hypothetical protein
MEDYKHRMAYGNPTPFPNEALLDQLSHQLAHEESISHVGEKQHKYAKESHLMTDLK